MNKYQLKQLIKEEVKSVLKEEGSLLMKEPSIKSKVEMVIKTLKDIDIDGETMQYILEKVGMDEQMQHQLTPGGIKEETTTTAEEKLIALANNSQNFNEFLKKAEQHLKSVEVNPSRGPLTATSYAGRALKNIWNNRKV